MFTQLKQFFQGIGDSLKIFLIYDVIFTSEKLQKKLLNCFLLNGLLFLGSIWIYNKLVFPIMYVLEEKLLLGYLEDITKYMFYLFWLLPMFLICNIVTSFWIDEIYFESLEIVEHSSYIKIEGQDFVIIVANQLQRLIIVVIIILQVQIFSIASKYIPGVFIFKYMTMSILNSLYVFEYILLQKYIRDYKSIMHFIETRLFYFFGFGILLTVMINYVDSFTTNSAIFLMAFPLFLIASVKVNNQRFKDVQIQKSRLIFFSFIDFIYENLVKLCLNLFTTKPSKKQ